MDQVVVFAGGVVTPTPAPGVSATTAPAAATVAPAAGTVSPAVGTNAPAAGTIAPVAATAAPGVTSAPVAAPVSVPVGAAFVMKISGGEITETQMGGGPIAVSRNPMRVNCVHRHCWGSRGLHRVCAS